MFVACPGDGDCACAGGCCDDDCWGEAVSAKAAANGQARASTPHMIPRGRKVRGIEKVAAENSWSGGVRRVTGLGFREKFMGNSGIPQAISKRYAPSTARSRYSDAGPARELSRLPSSQQHFLGGADGCSSATAFDTVPIHAFESAKRGRSD